MPTEDRRDPLDQPQWPLKVVTEGEVWKRVATRSRNVLWAKQKEDERSKALVNWHEITRVFGDRCTLFTQLEGLDSERGVCTAYVRQEK